VKYGWSDREFGRNIDNIYLWKEIVLVRKPFPKSCTGVKQLKNNVVGLLGYQAKRILSSESGCVANKSIKASRGFEPLCMPKYFFIRKSYRQTIKQIRRHFCELLMV